MDAKSVLRYVQQLCRDIDAGRPLRRLNLRKLLAPVAIPAALTLALGTVSCPESTEPTTETSCVDGIDNDHDGDIDCHDDDCVGEPDCALPEYGIPFEDVCDDGLDDDHDGVADCCDDDCSADEACGPLACPEYGAPLAEEDCRDCRDDDCDGLPDADDPDCSAVLYGAITDEVCNDGFDNDGDSLADCADSDCFEDPACMDLYGAPFI